MEEVENRGIVLLGMTPCLLVNSDVAFFNGSAVVVSKEPASGMWKKYN